MSDLNITPYSLSVEKAAEWFDLTEVGPLDQSRLIQDGNFNNNPRIYVIKKIKGIDRSEKSRKVLVSILECDITKEQIRQVFEGPEDLDIEAFNTALKQKGGHTDNLF